MTESRSVQGWGGLRRLWRWGEALRRDRRKGWKELALAMGPWV